MQVDFELMVREASHRERPVPRGQRQAEQLVGGLRVLVEQLVEIPHAKKEKHVRMLLLGCTVLLHDRVTTAVDGGIAFASIEAGLGAWPASSPSSFHRVAVASLPFADLPSAADVTVAGTASAVGSGPRI